MLILARPSTLRLGRCSGRAPTSQQRKAAPWGTPACAMGPAQAAAAPSSRTATPRFGTATLIWAAWLYPGLSQQNGVCFGTASPCSASNPDKPHPGRQTSARAQKPQQLPAPGTHGGLPAAVVRGKKAPKKSSSLHPQLLPFAALRPDRGLAEFFFFFFSFLFFFLFPFLLAAKQKDHACSPSPPPLCHCHGQGDGDGSSPCPCPCPAAWPPARRCEPTWGRGYRGGGSGYRRRSPHAAPVVAATSPPALSPVPSVPAPRLGPGNRSSAPRGDPRGPPPRPRSAQISGRAPRGPGCELRSPQPRRRPPTPPVLRARRAPLLLPVDFSPHPGAPPVPGRAQSRQQAARRSRAPRVPSMLGRAALPPPAAPGRERGGSGAGR